MADVNNCLSAEPVMTTNLLSKVLSVAVLALPLTGCISSPEDLNVYDTGSTDPDRFVAQTYPVWARPVVVKKKTALTSDVNEIKPVVVYESDGYPTTSPAALMSHPALYYARQRVSAAGYGEMTDSEHRLNAIPVEDVSPQYLRKEVAYATNERAGTIVVDTKTRHLYFVLGNGRAMRYGVGIGREGYAWKGRGVIQYKREWPRWTPSDNYVSEKPEMKMFSASYGGLVGGTNNPLGARAMYIYANGQDTLFRVHGTPDWKSVGKQVSSGCIRMFNQDVIDLYNRVGNRADIVVL
jgi:lipoprotein-anchoring transpeptidase ErfK/SrfK